LLPVCFALLAGCPSTPTPDRKIVAKGKVTKGGQPIPLNKAQFRDYAKVEIVFISEKDPNHKVSVDAEPDGTFVLAAEAGDPLPPGKYRVAINQWEPYPRKNTLEGKFDAKNTPIVVEITNPPKDIDIDIDKPQG
jgi:hypothetical protein